MPKGERFNPHRVFKPQFVLPDAIAAYQGIGWPAKGVYGTLLRFVTEAHPAPWPNQSKIAERAGMSRQAVGDQILALERAGLIEREPLTKGTKYHFLWNTEILGEPPTDDSEDEECAGKPAGRKTGICRKSGAEHAGNPAHDAGNPASIGRKSGMDTIRNLVPVHESLYESVPTAEGSTNNAVADSDFSDSVMGLMIHPDKTAAERRLRGWLTRYPEQDVIDVVTAARDMPQNGKSRLDAVNDELERRFQARKEEKRASASRAKHKGNSRNRCI